MYEEEPLPKIVNENWFVVSGVLANKYKRECYPLAAMPGCRIACANFEYVCIWERTDMLHFTYRDSFRSSHARNILEIQSLDNGKLVFRDYTATIFIWAEKEEEKGWVCEAELEAAPYRAEICRIIPLGTSFGVITCEKVGMQIWDFDESKSKWLERYESLAPPQILHGPEEAAMFPNGNCVTIDADHQIKIWTRSPSSSMKKWDEVVTIPAQRARFVEVVDDLCIIVDLTVITIWRQQSDQTWTQVAEMKQTLNQFSYTKAKLRCRPFHVVLPCFRHIYVNCIIADGAVVQLIRLWYNFKALDAVMLPDRSVIMAKTYCYGEEETVICVDAFHHRIFVALFVFTCLV